MAHFAVPSSRSQNDERNPSLKNKNTAQSLPQLHSGFPSFLRLKSFLLKGKKTSLELETREQTQVVIRYWPLFTLYTSLSNNVSFQLRNFFLQDKEKRKKVSLSHLIATYFRSPPPPWLALPFRVESSGVKSALGWRAEKSFVLLVSVSIPQHNKNSR
jgi:hypothetical protein